MGCRVGTTIRCESLCAIGGWRRLVIGAAVLIAAPSVSAAALEPAEPKAAAVAAIVVTARKRPENALDVPVALSVATGATLEARRLYQLQDLNQLAPSLNISYFNPRGSYVSIRGVGHSPASDGLEPSVGIFLDGVYLGRPGMAVFDLTDINDIEILRGPQGTLFGKNTSAGAIVITTREPDFDLGGRAEATVGNYGYRQMRGSVTGAVVPDVLALRLSAYHTGHDGWVQNPATGVRFNRSNRSGGRAQLRFEPDARLHVRVIGEYNQENDDCCALVAGSFGPASATYLSRVGNAGGSAILGGKNYLTLANAANRLVVRQGALTIQSDYDAGPVMVVSISGYRNWRYRADFDGDLSSAEAYDSAAVPSQAWQFSQEFRITSKRGHAAEWVVGAYYLRQSLKSDLQLQFGSRAANFLSNLAAPPDFLLAFNNQTSSTTADLQSETIALFGQVDWHVAPLLTVTAGLRGTIETKQGRVDRPANPAQPAYQSSLAIRDFDPSGTIAATYAASSTLRLFASYARGSKAGGINPIVSADPADLVVHPERTDSWEVGAKAILFDGAMRVDATLFRTSIQDYQATLNRIFAASLSNVGSVSAQGVELELHAVPTPGLALSGTASFNDAHYVSYRNAPCPPEATSATGCDLSGRPLSDAPRWMFNLAASYALPISNAAMLILAADVGYRSHYFGNLDDSRFSMLGNIAIANARMGVEFGASRVSIMAWVKNLANVRRLESYPLGGATVYGAYFGTVGDPRTIGLTVAGRL